MRKQCRRKVYTLSNPITMAIEGACISQGDALNKLRTRELAAIESFRTGSATVQDWSDLASMMNVCENMAKSGIGPEALQSLQEAHNHLMEAARRYDKTKKIGMTFQGLQCMRDVYEWHDLQRQSIDRRTYESHIKETMNKIRSKSPEVTAVLN